MPADLFAALRRGLRTLLGEFHWQAPSWLTTASQRARTHAAAAAVRVRARPAQSALIALGSLVLLSGAWLTWRWYESRPQPETVEFSVTAPQRTCYECVPPGRPHPLLVHFASSVAPLEAVGKNVEARDLIGMTPVTAGRWTWDDDRTLRFQPDEDWPIGATYEVTLARTGLVARHILLERHEFEFRSPAFEARVSDTQFHQDPVLARSKKAVVTLSFTHPVDARELEKRIELTMFDRVNASIEKELGKTAFTVVYDAPRLNAHIHSSELQMPGKAGRLQVVVGKGVRAQRGGNATQDPLRTSVNVPGLYSLRVSQLSAMVVRDEREEPDQVLVLAFNHSVKENDLSSRIQAWRLPVHHPDADLQRAYGQRQFPWNEQTLRREVLEASPKVALEYIPGEGEHSETHSFRHTEAPGTRLYVRVANGLKSFGGYVLADSDERFLVVPEYPKELRIVHQGSLLSATGTRSVTVMGRDVPGIRVEVGRLLPSEIHHFVSQTDGSFSRPSFQNWKFGVDDVSERFTKLLRVPQLPPGKAHYESIALSPFLSSDPQGRRGIFLLQVQPWDPEEADSPNAGQGDNWNRSHDSGVGDSRLVVVTDLGLLAKRSLDGSQDVFVQSLATGEPVAGANVQILGRNGLEVLAGVTDAQGHVRFADLSSFKREHEPVLYLARHGADMSFLPIEQRDRGLDLSRFEVGGVSNRVDPATLSAYLFSDRGLYRPGEEVRIGALVRSQDWTAMPEGVPLRIDVVDPRGISVRSEGFALGARGFGEFRLKTQPAWPAGVYTVSLSIVRPTHGTALLGSVEVQVREFLPDRLRMATRFSAHSSEGWVAPDDLQARVDLENLFGTPAQNRRVTARMTLSPAFPAFRAFPDHVFTDPQAAREGFTEELKEQTTDRDGEAVFDLNLQRFARATYRVHLMTEGFEADGGRGVTSEAAQLVSSMPWLVGWKGDGSLDYVSRGAERAVELIAIDPRAQRTAVADLVLVRLETRYVSALLRQNNGTYQYESRRKDIVLEQESLAIAAEGVRLKLATSQPGSFAYEVRDGAGQKLARIEYLVAGAANLSRTLEKNAELQIALAGKDYAPGDEIEMQIQAPYVGAGLITIERDRVYAWRWFRTTTTSSTQRIRLPEGIEGNAYVSVAFVRDPGSEEIYTSPLSYGIAPFSINSDRRRLDVKVQAPTLVKPGETLALRYSTTAPSRIVLFAVDEGILQVARYRTPDPLAHFFEKRALEVSTQQILDLILPEFRRNAAAPGGDAEAALGRHLNPFRRKGDEPVAFWSGILDADATTREVRYTVPDHFNGTLRVMAVAVTRDAIGVHESRTLVRGDFVLSPNAPTTVTPGDLFEVSVGLANNLEGSGANARITVALDVDAGLALEGEARQVLEIAENSESSARFRLRTLTKLGPAKLRFTASSGGNSARRTIDLSVRPSTPFMTSTAAGSLRKSSLDVPIERSMYPEHRTLEASLSLLPLAI
ncbi:MAG TPA: MG2 domain-containing protein, partial [Steroidobacteraceae bacterium]|nr:MG2 domain-containing protein [Steroidobacteraceae bacterium]